MSLSLLIFVNEFGGSNPLAKVDVEGSNPFSRSGVSRVSGSASQPLFPTPGAPTLPSSPDA
jgi:hypothetical protein